METGDDPGTKTVIQWRIESREKGAHRWRYIPFTGAGPYPLEAAAQRAATRQAGAPGARYEFRVTHRTVTTTTTAWEE